MSISDQILGSKTTQPKVVVTGPPNGGPASGVAPAQLPTVIKAEDAYKDFCVNLPQFVQRMRFMSWTGEAATAIGSTDNYAYVLSDRVPLGRYWEVDRAGMVCLGGSASQQNYPSLFLIPPTLSPNENSQPYSADATGFFAGQSAAHNNGPPVSPVALRVDEFDEGDNQNPVQLLSETTMIRTRKLIVPPGWRLMGYGGADGAGRGGALGEQWQLKIVFAEFLMSEDTNVR